MKYKLHFFFFFNLIINSMELSNIEESNTNIKEDFFPTKSKEILSAVVVDTKIQLKLEDLSQLINSLNLTNPIYLFSLNNNTDLNSLTKYKNKSLNNNISVFSLKKNEKESLKKNEEESLKKNEEEIEKKKIFDQKLNLNDYSEDLLKILNEFNSTKMPKYNESNKISVHVLTDRLFNNNTQEIPYSDNSNSSYTLSIKYENMNIPYYKNKS